MENLIYFILSSGFIHDLSFIEDLPKHLKDLKVYQMYYFMGFGLDPYVFYDKETGLLDTDIYKRLHFYNHVIYKDTSEKYKELFKKGVKVRKENEYRNNKINKIPWRYRLDIPETRPVGPTRILHYYTHPSNIYNKLGCNDDNVSEFFKSKLLTEL